MTPKYFVIYLVYGFKAEKCCRDQFICSIHLFFWSPAVPSFEFPYLTISWLAGLFCMTIIILRVSIYAKPFLPHEVILTPCLCISSNDWEVFPFRKLKITPYRLGIIDV